MQYVVVVVITNSITLLIAFGNVCTQSAPLTKLKTRTSWLFSFKKTIEFPLVDELVSYKSLIA